MIATASLAFSLISIVKSSQADRPSLEASEAGLHLLSCPQIFGEDNEGKDTDGKYLHIRLSLAASENLMGALKDSMQHARVVHTGNSNKKNPTHFTTISKSISDQIGLDDEQSVDVNVPRRSDNSHLCEVLKSIIDGNPVEESDSSMTISILKLERKDSSSSILRGAKRVIHPLFDQIVVKLSDLDHAFKGALTSFHSTAQTSVPPGFSPELKGIVTSLSAEA